MSEFDSEFLQRLRATFRVEADEHIHAISAGLLELEKAPNAEARANALEAVFRHTHSLKGAARATNFSQVESICQATETVFADWKRQPQIPASATFDLLHQAVDAIRQLVVAGDTLGTADNVVVANLTRQLAQLSNPDYAPASALAARASMPVSVAIPGESPVPAAAPAPAPRPSASETAPSPQPLAQVELAETVRVSTAKLDRLLLEAEEMLVVKHAAAQRVSDLQELDQRLSEWNHRWINLQPHLRAWRSDGSPQNQQRPIAEFLEWSAACMRLLESRLRSAGKSAAQDRHDIARRVDDLLADSKQLVLLPFSTLADLFPKIVRDLGRDQRKPADLIVEGGEVEIDKRILEEIKDPLIHLIRNSIDHGIEPRRDQDHRRKPPRATIRLAATLVGSNKVEISIADDGAGIDIARVKESALARGLLTADNARTMDDAKAMELIFQSDVSTSPMITELSGRGLGLAIVRERCEKLGGQVAVKSSPSVGTRFEMTLPLTLATFRGILVQSLKQVFVLPTSYVARVTRVRAAEVKTIENRETVRLDDRAVALVRLDAVLNLPRQNSNEADNDFVSIVLIGSGDAQVALGVDAVLHEEEVLAKSLTSPLSRVRNIAGATVLASGKVAPILHVADLLKSARKSGAAQLASARSPTKPAADRTRAVLLAEDSITSRMLLKGILESAGYRVTTAVDGVDAWTALHAERFDLVISDVEMPRLNGFDLCARIRADKKFADTPVVLVTALASAADRERGIDVGASAYIVKSSFDQSNLLEIVRRFA